MEERKEERDGNIRTREKRLEGRYASRERCERER
jgi:hypothetical protein